MKLQEQALAAALEALKQAQQRVESADPGADPADTGRLVMARDEALRTQQAEESRYQLARTWPRTCR